MLADILLRSSHWAFLRARLRSRLTSLYPLDTPDYTTCSVIMTTTHLTEFSISRATLYLSPGRRGRDTPGCLRYFIAVMEGGSDQT